MESSSLKDSSNVVPCSNNGTKPSLRTFACSSADEAGKVLDTLQPLRYLNKVVNKSKLSTTYYACTWKECNARFAVAEVGDGTFCVSEKRAHRHNVAIVLPKNGLHVAMKGELDELLKAGKQKDELYDLLLEKFKPSQGSQEQENPFIADMKSINKADLEKRIARYASTVSQKSVAPSKRKLQLSMPVLASLKNPCFSEHNAILHELRVFRSSETLEEWMGDVRSRLEAQKAVSEKITGMPYYKVDNSFCGFLGIVLLELCFTLSDAKCKSFSKNSLTFLYGIAQSLSDHFEVLLSSSEDFANCALGHPGELGGVHSKLKEVKQHTPKELVPTFAAAFGKLKLRAAVIEFLTTAINVNQALWQVKLKKRRIVNFPPQRVKHNRVSYFREENGQWLPIDRSQHDA